MHSRRTSSNMPHRVSGFSLIELLVVIGIIAILVALLMVAIGMANQGAKRAKAKVQIKQLEKAIQGYKDDNFHPADWPTLSVPYNAQGIKLRDVAAKILAGSNSTGQVYFDISDNMIRVDRDGARGFVDPWGRCFKFLCDYDDDGKLELPFPSSVGSANMIVLEGVGVAVWSQGPDGDDALVGDNVTSWKTQ